MTAAATSPAAAAGGLHGCDRIVEATDRREARRDASHILTRAAIAHDRFDGRHASDELIERNLAAIAHVFVQGHMTLSSRLSDQGLRWFALYSMISLPSAWVPDTAELRPRAARNTHSDAEKRIC